MLDIILENKAGKQLTFDMNSPFSIVAIDGLGPADATINMSQYAIIDGGRFNSSKVNVRNVNIAFSIDYEAAKNRVEAFKVIKPGQYIKLIYRGQYRQGYLEGYVNNMPITYFEMKQTITFTMICPVPYFQAMDPTYDEFRSLADGFHFAFYSEATPKTIKFGKFTNLTQKVVENNGDVECGVIFDLAVNGTIEGDVTITNDETSEFFKFSTGTGLHSGDRVIISTIPGELYIQKNNGSRNLAGVRANSAWLRLPVEGASFSFAVTTGTATDIAMTVIHTDLFEGV